MQRVVTFGEKHESPWTPVSDPSQPEPSWSCIPSLLIFDSCNRTIKTRRGQCIPIQRRRVQNYGNTTASRLLVSRNLHHDWHEHLCEKIYDHRVRIRSHPMTPEQPSLLIGKHVYHQTMHPISAPYCRFINVKGTKELAGAAETSR
uniref:Uncharacterized protein n=1 Tax=Mycena chlorophos TaxID=658473 RepID=A0ABQ0L617_MYCCL|nr:predicted protein [Mycena chlorophos]